VYDELMTKMDSVMIGKSKSDIAFQKAIDQANLYFGALKIPFIRNLLRLSVSEMERVAWILWMSNNTEWNLLDDKSSQVTKETRNIQLIPTNQMYTIIRHYLLYNSLKLHQISEC
jgi:hypothetical protein